ncbi:MAG: TIGR03790 family protein [Myxococcota bacterium]|nr:TIGR03790 family protein [Myxococcota bacterium]
MPRGWSKDAPPVTLLREMVRREAAPEPVAPTRVLRLWLVHALVLVALVAATGCFGERHPEVLVIVNSESPTSLAIGRYYAELRGVPAGNVVELAISLDDPTLADAAQETVSAEQYHELLREPIERYLEEYDLRDTIEIIVTTKGIPLRIDGKTATMEHWLNVTTQAAVDAELSLLFSDAAGSAGISQSINPYFDARVSFGTFREENPDSPLRYMVARLTGYANEFDRETQLPVDVKRLIDGANGPAIVPGDATWLVDEDPSRGPGHAIANRIWLEATASILSAMKLPVTHDRENEFVSDRATIVGYTSWGSNDGNDAGKPYYGEIDGDLYPGTFGPRSIAVDLVSTGGRTFTHPPKYGQSLTADLVHLGASGATGHVYEPALSGVPRPHILLPTYASGVRAVEAFYRSIPYLGWMNIYVGDPLMTTPVPRIRPEGDRDRDGVPDENDNCTEVPNPEQRDTNADGFGNLCDPDVDGDGLVTTSWGEIYPLTRRGDVEWIAMSSQNGPYDPNFDLDGDGDVDGDDITIAHMTLFMPPGPSGQAETRR